VDALRERNFRLLFAARGISYVGTYLAPIAVAFAVLDLGGSATEVGLSFAAWTIAQVATLAFGGVVGDRLPRRAVMIGSDAASFCVRTTMGVLLVAGHAHVWELIALQAVGGSAVGF
jgi:MFS family permease